MAEEAALRPLVHRYNEVTSLSPEQNIRRKDSDRDYAVCKISHLRRQQQEPSGKTGDCNH
jgi:hypothetical protein